MTIRTKTCPKCGLEKDTRLFSKNRTGADGLCSWCKDCMRPVVDSWNRKNQERKSAYGKLARAKRRKDRLNSPEFVAGAQAARDGMKIVACPYDIGKQRRGWIDGFLSVQLKAIQK